MTVTPPSTPPPAPDLDPQGAPPVEPPAPESPDTDANEDNEPDGLDGLRKALAAERKLRKTASARAKELEAYEKQVKETEEANKSELTKAQEALAAVTAEREKAATELLRYQVASAKGVPPNLTPFLNGANKEEMETAADVLLAEIGPQRPAVPGRPQERLVNGKPSQSNLDSEDPMTLIRMAREQAEGSIHTR